MSDIRFSQNNIRAISILGLWEYGKIKHPFFRKLFYVYGRLLYFYFLTFNISEFIEMFRVMDNLILFMSNAAVSLLYGVTIMKGFTILFRRKYVQQLLEGIRRAELRVATRSMEEKQLYEENVQHNMFVSKLFWYLCALTVPLFYIARPAEYWYVGPQEIHGYKVPLVFSCWYPFDKFADGNFEIVYCVQILTGFVGASYVATLDVFLVSFLIFSVGQFKILQCAIKNVHVEKEKYKIGENGFIDVYDSVVEIIKEHNISMDFVVQIDNLLKTIVFVNFLTCSMLICAIGLEGIMAGVTPRLFLNIFYLMVVLVQIFIFYWHANEIYLESGNMGQAVAESQWYTFSLKVKKALLMILIRSQKPCTLSIGGFYNMSLNSFLMILRSAYSFLVLFRKMYARQNEVII